MRKIIYLLLILGLILSFCGCARYQTLEEEAEKRFLEDLEESAKKVTGDKEEEVEEEEVSLKEKLYEMALTDPDLADDIYVYVPFKDGHWYHLDEDCCNKPISISLEKALADGYVPCPKCCE